MNSPRLLLATLALVATSLFAEDPTTTGAALQAPNEPVVYPLIRVDVEMVAVPFDKGMELLPNLRDPGSIDGAVSQIQKLIASGGATLIGWPELITKSGQRAVTEDIQEVRYATDFVKHRIISTDKFPQDAVVRQGAGAPVPTEFETRNAGITLEVEPVIGPDGVTIDLNLVPQYVRLIDMPVVAMGRDRNDHEWHIDQPRFYTAKTTTSVTLTSGHRMLLAQFRGPEGGDQILFFILKAEVVPSPKQNHKSREVTPAIRTTARTKSSFLAQPATSRQTKCPTAGCPVQPSSSAPCSAPSAGPSPPFVPWPSCRSPLRASN